MTEAENTPPPADPALRRLALTLAYDGRPFCGWQSQAGRGGVQDALEAAFARLHGGGRIAVHGSGRTDAGVHALAQVAHADVPGGRFGAKGGRQGGAAPDPAPGKWLAALNAHLPPEVRVTRCEWAPPGFHARFSATGKRYVYRLWHGPVMPPLELGRAWFLPRPPGFPPLDTALLSRAAGLLTGTHDFAAFAANRGVPYADTVRTLHRVGIATGRDAAFGAADVGAADGGPPAEHADAPGQLITLTFEGDGFLYKMVRLLTGALVRVAQGKASPEWLAAFLQPPPPGARPPMPRPKNSFDAPAEGLYLARVFYGAGAGVAASGFGTEKVMANGSTRTCAPASWAT